MFNRTLYDKQSTNNQEILNRSKRHMSGNNRPIDTPTRRGYSGVKKIEIGSANKIKGFNEINVTPLHLSKPILAGFHKKDDRLSKFNYLGNKSSFRQTVTGFTSFKQKEKLDQRLYQTSTNGFGLNHRNTIKQQTKIDINNPKQKQKNPIEENQIDNDDIHSIQEDMDQQDRQMILNHQKISNNIIHRQERPQTSKGFRKKLSSSTDLQMSVGQNLFDELKQPYKMKDDMFQQIKIPIKSIQYDKKMNHPSSAHPKYQMKKQFDQLFKTSTTSPKKNNIIDKSTPFESLIGSEFLSLFANKKHL